MGIVMQPWKLMADYGSYIFGWLVGYSGFLGPIAGVLICDYFVVRKKFLIVEDLYQRNGQYEYSRGFQLDGRRGSGRGSRSSFRRPGGSAAPRPSTTTRGSWVFLVSFLTYFVLMNRV